jgi:hypothetical protein
MKPLEVRCADLNRSDSDCLALTQTVPTGFRLNHVSAARRRAQQEQSPCGTLRQKTSRRQPGGPRNFLGGKTDNSDVTVKSDDKRTIQGDPRLRHAYPYFRIHLEEIAACVEGGCSVKSVWRSYTTRTPEPFPGSYSSFLRYCRKHCESVTAVEPQPVKAREQKPSGVGSALGHSKRYPPPRKRPPGLTPEQIQAMTDPDDHLDPKR